MSKTTDWLPASRQEQIEMALVWKAAIGSKLTEWNIPVAVDAQFSSLVSAAQAALLVARNEATRTPVTTAECKTAFDALISSMRSIKKRYFFVPPLTDSDLVSLGLKIPDRTPTASGTPNAQVTIETYLVGRHELGVKIVYVTGNPADRANKGYRIWYSVVEQGGDPATTPRDLHESFYTHRKKDVIDFDFGDSGKTVWFAVQVENDGKKGPWGPLTSALIP